MDIVHKTAIDREKMQTDRMTNRETKDKKECVLENLTDRKAVKQRARKNGVKGQARVNAKDVS